ncbi:MAG: serine hydrolase domain-containing protein [Nitrolancea sp.]
MSRKESAGDLSRVQRRIERFVEDGEIAGAGLAISKSGEVIADWYTGQAADGLLAGPNVLWPLASASKLYSAAAIMAVVEQGDLTLSTLVNTVLPEFTGNGREHVRLRHLLTHTSGLIYESPEMEKRLIDQTPIDDIIDEAYSHPLLSKPGTRFEYSDFGIALAARMACVVTGLSFPDLVRVMVLEPASLTNTFMPPDPSDYGRIAHVVGTLGYGTDGAMYNSPYALQLAHPSFGTVASAFDVLKFGLLFAPGAKNPIVSSATARAMTVDQTGGTAHGNLVDFELPLPQPWGLGFELNFTAGGFGLAEIGSPATFGHGGASGCVLMVDPINEIGLAYVSNSHANIDMERWYFRLSAVANGVIAALTR